MAAKRLSLGSSSDRDQSDQDDRIRSRPSIAFVIGGGTAVNSVQNICCALEPLIRRVVNEEVERGFRRGGARVISRSPSLRIQAPQPQTLKLLFLNQPSGPIFSGTKLLDGHARPLQLLLVDAAALPSIVPAPLPFPIKVEIVALEGGFCAGDGAAADSAAWTREEFDAGLIRERAGKRPLLAGEVCVSLRDGAAIIRGIEFTDNSSWVRSRKFRIGARVAPESGGGGVRIREAVTEAFVVKDHRGELYKKHHPPKLNDEVWRLEKIGKDGSFHRKLASAGINTVQDFLKLSVVDSRKLRQILGNGMSDRKWEVTIRHAQTCDKDNKFYIFYGSHFTILLDCICQVVEALINGRLYSAGDLISMNKTFVEKLAKEAYANWNSLQEIERLPNEMTPLLAQDTTYQFSEVQDMGSLGYMDCSNWPSMF